MKQGLEKNKEFKRGAKLNDIEKYKLENERVQEPERLLPNGAKYTGEWKDKK